MDRLKTNTPDVMRTWVVPEHGGVDVLKLETRSVPEPGPGDLRIRTSTCALNHLDLWVRRGVPGHTFPLPLVPCSDVAGTVDKSGDACDDVPEGTRVVLMPGVTTTDTCMDTVADNPLGMGYGIRGETFDGGASEYLIVRKRDAVPIPDHLDWNTAAAFGLTFLTAYRMVFTRGQVGIGDWVLVHAAGSGVSSAAIQMAKMAGARVIATAGSDEKLELAKSFGVEKLINYKKSDFAKEVKAVTDRRGVDVIIDHVGRETFEGNIKCLAKGGRLVICGNTTGPLVEVNLAMIFFKGLGILGSTMGTREEFLKSLELVSRGLVKPVIDKVFEFEQLPEAHEYLESGKVFGKVLLKVSED